MTPTWYDLLGVEPDASEDEIRAAWKAAIADLDPTDRRFRTLNEAAEVLLDGERRAAYDASLEPEADEPSPRGTATPEAEERTGRSGSKRRWKRQTRRNQSRTREPRRDAPFPPGCSRPWPC